MATFIDPMDRLLKTCTDPETLSMVMLKMIRDELERRNLDTKGTKQELVPRLVDDNIRRRQESENVRTEDESEIESIEEIDAPQAPDPVQIPQPAPGQATEIYLAQLMGALGMIMQQNQQMQVNLQKQQAEDRRDIQRKLNLLSQTPDIQIHTTPDLYTSIPTFHGKRTDSASEWLENLNRVARQQNWKPETKLSTAASLLRDEAQDWQETSGYKIRDWNNWTDLFLTHFSKPLTVREWTSVIETRIQRPGERLSEYIRSKLKILNRSPVDMSIRDKLDYLISGIAHEATAHIMKLQHFTDVNELFEATREIDDLAPRPKIESACRQGWRDTREGQRRQPKIPIRDERQTSQRPRSQFQREMPRQPTGDRVVFRKGMDKRDITCFNCERKGHLSFECDQPMKSRMRTPYREGNPRNPLPSPRVQKVNCLLRSKEPNLPVVKGFVEQRETDVLLDSGSEVSLIDKKHLSPDAKIRS